MRIALSTVGVILALMGVVWCLQGVGILPGSFMSGQTRWAVYGCVAVIAGVTLIVRANRHRPV